MMVRSIPFHTPDLDRVNRRTWRRRHMIRQFAKASGWLEPGERIAIERIADAVRNEPILDIGVGGGRTAPLLTNLSVHYSGIDYLPEMVAAAQRRFPDLCFREMDARRLQFAAHTFRLVFFSYNGIDAVDLAGRLQIFREVHRVLVPGGYLVFSALNRQGTAYREQWPDFTVFRGAGYSPTRLGHALARFLIGGLNSLRARCLSRAGPDIAIGAISAHNFGLLTLFTSIREQLSELQACGFVVEAVIDPAGRYFALDHCDPGTAPWHYFIARKPNQPGPDGGDRAEA